MARSDPNDAYDLAVHGILNEAERPLSVSEIAERVVSRKGSPQGSATLVRIEIVRVRRVLLRLTKQRAIEREQIKGAWCYRV